MFEVCTVYTSNKAHVFKNEVNNVVRVLKITATKRRRVFGKRDLHVMFKQNNKYGVYRGQVNNQLLDLKKR